MSQGWKAQRERSSPALVAFLIWFALACGRGAARALLHPISAYFYATGPGIRAASRDFLGRVLGRPVRAGDVYRHIHTFAACVLDRAFLLAGRHRGLDIRVADPSTLLRPQPGERGCLLLVSHLGSFEAMRVLGQERKQLAFRILMDRGHSRIVQEALERLNPGFAAEIIDAAAPGPELVLRLKEAIEAGHLVGVMADRVREGEPAVEVDFLGGRARLPSTPWLLAAALKVKVVLCFGLYRGGARYDLHFEPLSPPLVVARSERAALVGALAQRYADRLAHYARQAPYNWFNFFDYWPAPEPAAPAAGAARLGPGP